MEASNSLSDIVERVRSWIPHRGEALASSPRRNEAQASTPTIRRDFWMPDNSCPFCFACNSQFTLFHRRHHCRLCGFVFCGKCSLHTISATVEEGVPLEEGERLRVCNYCFDRREQDSCTPSAELPLELFPTSPLGSLCLLSECSGAETSVDPISPVFGGASDRSFLWYEALDESSEPQDTMRAHEGDSKVLDSMPHGARDQSSGLYRSDEDEDEFEKQQENKGKEMSLVLQSREDETDDDSALELGLDSHSERKLESSPTIQQLLSDDGSEGTRRGGETADGKGSSSEGMEEVTEDYAIPMYEGAITVQERKSVDYESNSLIWIPPVAGVDQDDDDQENEDGDLGASIVGDDDDDDDDEGEGWGVSQSPGSVSAVIPKKDKLATSEHKNSIRPQVAGHFRSLVAQLLQQEHIDVGEADDPESWLKIVSALSWQAANLIKPDTSKGGGMDPGGYVKVKCIASGKPSDSGVVDGIVCRKNVAHKRMRTRYENPRLLLLGGALEYQRVSNQLSSLDTLLQQERDHLSMTVARIETHHPNVLLVEKTVSRFAQDILVDKNITLALHVKKPLLERIARCVGAQVVSSPDNLVAPKAVHCNLFHVEKFAEEHGTATGGKHGPKHLMFFEGCRNPLGCTILLKGANGDYLKKVKRVVHLAVFSAYHLALETSFLADEGATLPEAECKTPPTVPRLSKSTTFDMPVSSGFPTAEPLKVQSVTTTNRSSSMPVSPPRPSVVNRGGSTTPLSNFENASSTVYTVPLSSTSSAVSSSGNSPDSSPAQSVFGFQSGVSRTASIGGTQTTTYHHVSNGVYPGGQTWQGVSGLSVSLKREADSNALRQDVFNGGSSNIGSMAFEVKALEVNTITGPSNTPHAEQTVTTSASMLSKGTIQDHGNDYQIVPEEVQAHLRVLIQNNWQSQLELSKEDFPPSPSDHESILVQLSSRCITKGAVCKAPHFLRIQYYGNADKPLGSFLRDSLFDTNHPCRSCEEPGDAHVHCFTHRQGSLTISVRRLDPALTLSGEKEGRIWMWHRCLRCTPVSGVPPATPRVIMSEAACGLSFGKFLELSFSTHSAASRVAACGHSLHRDCLRFYGFGNMVACFRYSHINLHSVFLPPLRLEFNCQEQQTWLRKEVDEVDAQANLVFVEVFNGLRVLGEKIASSRALYGNSTALDAKRRIAALENLLQKEKAALEETLQQAKTVYLPGQPSADILELNWLRRELYIRAAQWEWRLKFLTSKSLPTRKRATGSIDDPAILSMTELNIGPDTPKVSETQEAERDSLQINIPVADIQRLPSDAESNLESNTGSSPSELNFVDGDSTEVQSSGVEQVDPSEDINNSQDPVVPTELADGNGLDFRLGGYTMSDSSRDLLNNVDLVPARKLSPSKSMFLESLSVPKDMRPQFGTTGGIDNTEASSLGDDSVNVEVDGAFPTEASPSFLEGEVTARRALSEGNFPLLADLSTTLDGTWTADGGVMDADTVNSAVGKLLEISCGTVNGETHDAESEGPDHHNLLMDQATSDLGTQEGDLPAQDTVVNNDAHISVPTSPVKSDSSADELQEGWMGAPFTNFFKNYIRTPSTIPLNTDLNWPPPGPASILPRAAQIAADGGVRVFLPLGHDDVVVAVYDDEPTTMIAYALSTEDHYVHVTDLLVEKEKLRDKEREKELEKDPDHLDHILSHPLQTSDILGEVDIAVKESINIYNDPVIAKLEHEIENPLTSSKAALMVKKTISFSDDAQGKVKFQVTCYFAKQFDALRKQCCMGNTEYIRSLCRCKKWGAQGGKSNVFFAKTADDRFVVKQVTRTELTSFLDFASSYFKYLNEALKTGNPTCLAKIFGVYEVRTSKGGKETKMDVLVMENLLYGRNITRLYDLKGSVRSRYNADATGKNSVLLDQNLVEAMPTNPIFVGKKAKRLLERAVWNDTHFLSLVFVMDYSLLVGVDEERGELVVGIIDFIRQYTWDKHLETWVKASGFLGGPKNAPPTVISPIQYKKRFRKAMKTYFLMVPDEWIPPPQLTVPPPVDTVEDNTISIVMKKEDATDDANPLRQHLSSH